MPLNYTSTKVVGNPDASGWVQVHDYVPDSQEKIVRRGRLYAVISTQTIDSEGQLYQNDKQRLEMGREILARLHEEYYGQLEDSAFNCLAAAVSRVSSEFTSRQMNVEIGALVFLNDNLLGACANGAVLLVLRHGQLVPLITTQRGNHLSVSGKIVIGDKYIIGTQQLLHTISEGILKGSLETDGLAEFSETITPKILNSPRASSTGILVVEIEEKYPVKSDEQRVVLAASQPQITKVPKIKNKLVGFIDTLLAHLPDPRLKVKPDTIDVETGRKRKSLPLVGLLILIILAASIVFGVKQKNAKEKQAELMGRISEIEREYEEAQSLVGLNKARAKELLLSARADAQKLKEGQGAESEELDKLVQNISNSLGPVAGVYEVNPELYLDTSLISQGFQATKLVYSDEAILVMDDKNKKIVSIELENKTTEFVAGPDYLKDALDLAFYAGRSFVLSSDGVREITDDVELVVKPEDWDPKRVLISAFAGNLYVLDRENNQVWRYPGVQLGSSPKEAWLAPGVEPDFSEVEALGIDGSVWVLTKSGKVEKYTRGNKDNFSVKDHENNFSFSKFYVDEDSEYLYFYDSLQTKFLKFSQDGEFESEYVNPQFTAVDGFVVSESQNKLIYLKEGKLYEFKLN